MLVKEKEKPFCTNVLQQIEKYTNLIQEKKGKVKIESTINLINVQKEENISKNKNFIQEKQRNQRTGVSI